MTGASTGSPLTTRSTLVTVAGCSHCVSFGGDGQLGVAAGTEPDARLHQRVAVRRLGHVDLALDRSRVANLDDHLADATNSSSSTSHGGAPPGGATVLAVT